MDTMSGPSVAALCLFLSRGSITDTNTSFLPSWPAWSSPRRCSVLQVRLSRPDLDNAGLRNAGKCFTQNASVTKFPSKNNNNLPSPVWHADIDWDRNLWNLNSWEFSQIFKCRLVWLDDTVVWCWCLFEIHFSCYNCNYFVMRSGVNLILVLINTLNSLSISHVVSLSKHHLTVTR